MRLGLSLSLGAIGSGAIGAISYDYFVDSVSGSDANDGTSLANAFETLGAGVSAISANENVVFAKGSEWGEAWDTNATDNIGIYVQGTGDTPVVDGADVVTAWTAEGTANVYQASVAHDGFGTNRVTVYEDGALMARVADVATCSATPGSYVALEASSGTPWTVKIHPTGSGDPTSNGSTYEVANRRRGVYLGDNCTVTGPLETKRAIGNNGSFQMGIGSTASQILAVYGTKHNMLMADGSFTDCIACRADTATASEPSSTWFVFYDDDGAGLTASMTRCGVVPDGFNSGGIPVIVHDAVGNVYDSFAGEQLWGINCSSWEPTGLTVTLNGYYGKVSTGSSGAGFGGYMDTGTFRYIQINHSIANVGQAFGATFYGATSATETRTITLQDLAFYTLDSTTNLMRIGNHLNGATLVLRNCVFYLDGFRSLMQAIGTAWTSGALTIENCIFAYPSNGVPIVVPSGITYTGDNNVFLDNSASGTNLNLSYNGTTYDTLADWRTATGQDANSVAYGASDISTLFSGTVADGDFTLGGTGAGAAAAALEAGPQFHWDWNARAAAAGPPTAWPDVPETLAESRTYIADPEAWDFYP